MNFSKFCKLLTAITSNKPREDIEKVWYFVEMIHKRKTKIDGNNNSNKKWRN